jgi:hypothetical protein
MEFFFKNIFYFITKRKNVRQMMRTSLKDAWGDDDQPITPKSAPVPTPQLIPATPNRSPVNHISPRYAAQPAMVNMNPEMFQQLINSSAQYQEPAPVHTDTRERLDVQLLTNINQLLADSENFIIQKTAKIQKNFNSQLSKTMSTAFEEYVKPSSTSSVSWLSVVILIVVCVLFVILFVLQYCYFSKTKQLIQGLNLARVPLDVYHPNLVQL